MCVIEPAPYVYVKVCAVAHENIVPYVREMVPPTYLTVIASNTNPPGMSEISATLLAVFPARVSRAVRNVFSSIVEATDSNAFNRSYVTALSDCNALMDVSLLLRIIGTVVASAPIIENCVSNSLIPVYTNVYKSPTSV